ncbi:PREDICTED: protein disulfide isomerase-like 1-1 [Camelina sativa]|uniref:protein disulfide-isomerase n=1 Tax=Camelina sativa TaxID=90675 RepID=A0ABM1R7J7_CAMSA|nr:PREDICTED: protein disulfide isomerase-like 1-1 [Camelina sativa]
MAITGYVLFWILLLSFASSIKSEHTETKELVLTLNHSNYDEIINKHNFIVVNFYTSWYIYCDSFNISYEEVASELSSHVPPVVFAKIDASEEANREFVTTDVGIARFPSILIFRYRGKLHEWYLGPKKADDIAFFLKRLSKEPLPSLHIKSADDVAEFVGDKKVFVVGIFPKLPGSEFDSFLAAAYKFRADYDSATAEDKIKLHFNYTFAHTLDAKLLPSGEPTVTGPLVRIFKPFDELVVDSKDFESEALEKFVKESSFPLVTVFDKDPNNTPYVIRFFYSPYTKVMLYINLTGEAAESFKCKYREVATSNKGQGLRFLLGGVNDSQGTLKNYGHKESHIPLIIIETASGKNYLKANVEIDQIESWVKDFKEGKLAPYVKSQPIPTENNDLVKVVVSNSFDDMVFKSVKNVMLIFYVPWSKFYQKLVPMFDEIAVSYQNDPSVVIAKIDLSTNDIPRDTFDVKGVPTIYFISASGNIVVYHGDGTKEDFISFIHKNKDTVGKADKKEKTTKEAKDEL